MCIRLDEQLYRNYNELYSLIIQCYKDVSILKVYMELQAKECEVYSMTPNVTNHIVKATQMELALTLWKMYFDNDSKANTIPKFRNSINGKLHTYGIKGQRINRSKIKKEIEDNLNLLRRQFLAHADMTRSDNRIEMSDLFNLLDVMYKEFNCICSVIDDDRVSGISEENIGLQDMEIQVELLALYN